MTPMDPHELRPLLREVDPPDPGDVVPSAVARGRALRQRRRTVTAALTGGLLVAVAAVGVLATQLLDPGGPAPMASPSPTVVSGAPTAPTPAPSTPVEPTTGESSPGPATTGPSATEPSATEPSTTQTPSHTPAEVITTQRPVYYLTEGPAGAKVVREARDVSAETPARGAVEAMLRAPVDPDYFTPWPSAVEVLGIAHRDGLITVDLSGEALRPNVGAAYEEAMYQQLVWTLTGVLEEDADVQVHVGGRPVESLAGHVDWSQPRGRADFDEGTLNSLWIDTPADGAQLNSPVTIEGQAIAFEANVPYTLFDDEGGIVVQGATLALEGQARSPWSLTLDLEPGTYLIEVREDDPSDGEGGPVDLDTRAFTVVDGTGS